MLEGLKPGETVIRHPANQIEEGVRVKTEQLKAKTGLFWIKTMVEKETTSVLPYRLFTVKIQSFIKGGFRHCRMSIFEMLCPEVVVGDLRTSNGIICAQPL